MGKDLPARAERFLSALSNALDGLSSHERDTVLLELRGHLLARAGEGDAALDETLRELGTPEALAADFGEGGAGSLVAVPDAFATPRKRMRAGEVVREVRATYLARRKGLVSVGLVLTAGTSTGNVLLWTTQGCSGPVIEGCARLEPFSPIVVWLTLILAVCAGYRTVMGGEGNPWKLNLSTLLFVAAMMALELVSGIAILAVYALSGLVAGRSAGASEDSVVSTIGIAVGGAAFFYFTLRIQPWFVGLAVPGRRISLRRSWQGTSGWMFNILFGWAIMVLPPYFMNLAASRLAVEIPVSSWWLVALAVADGILLMVMVMGIILINATIYRWALGEPIPGARGAGKWSGTKLVETTQR